MTEQISITAISSISPLGISPKEIWNAYLNDTSLMTKQNFDNESVWVGTLTREGKRIVEALKESDSKYRNLDESVLYAMLVARNAMQMAGWVSGDNFGINIGSFIEVGN